MMYSKRAIHKRSHHHSDHQAMCRGGGRGRGRGRRSLKEKFANVFSIPPANVRENDDSYELHIFAPGFEKKDFIIAVIDQQLSISVKDKMEEESWKRQEFVQKGFVRTFELNEAIDTAAIVAKYENGVLMLNLPKLEGFETNRQDIEVT